MIFETNNRKVPYPKRGLTVWTRAGSEGCQGPLPGSKLSTKFYLPYVYAWLLSNSEWQSTIAEEFLSRALFVVVSCLSFLGGGGGGGGGERKRRLDKRMVGVNSWALIAIFLVLKQFGCLFLLFSNPRIPIQNSSAWTICVSLFFLALKYWEAWSLVAILIDRVVPRCVPRR